MNEPLPGLMAQHMGPWIDTARNVKRDTVLDVNVPSDLYPSVLLVCPGEDPALRLHGIVGDPTQRQEVADPFSHCTRWGNLLRQVIAFTKADIVMTCIEVAVDPNRTGGATDALEVAMITRQSTVTRHLPYTYDIGRKIVWGAPLIPAFSMNSASAQEWNAARLAWLDRDQVAYKASVRFLSIECQVAWQGDAEMIERLS